MRHFILSMVLALVALQPFQVLATLATRMAGEMPGIKAWEGEVEATWDISQAKFTAQKVKREFAGARKGG
jgi:hypothetical protein